MTPVSLSQTGAGASAVAALDNFLNPFIVGIGTTVTGSATYGIEYSFDDPMDADYVAASATWFVASGFSALTAGAGGALTIPCKAIRINIASGTGTVVAKIIQAGTR